MDKGRPEGCKEEVQTRLWWTELCTDGSAAEQRAWPPAEFANSSDTSLRKLLTDSAHSAYWIAKVWALLSASWLRQCLGILPSFTDC